MTYYPQILASSLQNSKFYVPDYVSRYIAIQFSVEFLQSQCSVSTLSFFFLKIVSEALKKSQ